MCNKYNLNKQTEQDGYKPGGILWICARLFVVPHPAVRHLRIGHSHTYINKARTIYVMLTQASAASPACGQSSNPQLSDAQVDSKALNFIRNPRGLMEGN